jgi:general secretion pathway protein K
MSSAADRQQRGVAIVMAMAVVAMATLAATTILVTQSTWARRAELSQDHVQAQLLIQTGLDWARAILADDLLMSSADHSGEPWALRLPAMPVDNGTLLGHIEDQQGRFDLNRLLQADGSVDEQQLIVLRRLLVSLKLPPQLAELVTARHVVLQDVAELAEIPEFDADVRARLLPHVTALPALVPLNANTATAEVLAAVIPGLGLDRARMLVARRQRAWFRNHADFVAQLPPELLMVSRAATAEDRIGVSSQYFVVSAQVAYGTSQARGTALLVRPGQGWPRIVWRKYL